MDYEKKYKEALERAKGIHSFSSDIAEIKRMEQIFPELKESEDERIIKAQLDYWRSVGGKEWHGVPVQETIAWLEKQGEQKSVDKLEPKFKVGDWVVFYKHHNSIYQVERIDNYRYYLRHYLGGTLSVHFDNEFIRLWTIKDAKDGDVLVNGSNIFIFHFLNDTRLMGYCHINTDDGRFYNDLGKNECFCLIDAVVTPATKEQRDLLFQKMHEAGYEWDENKKELRKIEDEKYDGEDYGIDSLFHAQRILEKTLGEVAGYQTDCGILSHKCAITAVKKLYEQKSTEWNEEDEHRLKDAIYFLDAAKTHYACTVELDACINWLKSLKQRMEV